MGGLVVIEGLDGSGKRTLMEALVADLSTRRVQVATLAFPRYGHSVHADLAAEALRDEHGDVAGSVNAMALLFALDRVQARGELAKLLVDNDIVLVDRYVASNAAYSAGRTGQPADGEIVRWIEELEFDRFALPLPDLHVLLDVPITVAAARARRRGELDSARSLDAYERDADLQQRTAAVYRDLAHANWRSTWWIHTLGDDPAVLAARLWEFTAE